MLTLPGGTYPFELSFPVPNDKAQKTTTAISGNFVVEPVVSAQHSMLFACEKDGSTGTVQMCPGTGLSVRHNSVVRFEVLANDVSGHVHEHLCRHVSRHVYRQL